VQEGTVSVQEAYFAQERAYFAKEAVDSAPEERFAVEPEPGVEKAEQQGAQPAEPAGLAVELGSGIPPEGAGKESF